MGTRSALVLIALSAIALSLVLASSASALSSSQNVALVPSSTGQAGSGGNLPQTGFPNGYAPSFTNVALADIQDSGQADPLPAYDTVVLVQVCNIDNYLSDATFKSRLESFVQNGGKLLIWDSECINTDYSKFTFPFSTNNPGANGSIGGTLTDVEDNTLGSPNSSSQYFIDYGLIASGSDAVGDSNVFVSFDQHWCVDLKATNTREDGSPGINGPVQTYAAFGNGLIVYEGLDMDAIDNGTGGFDASSTAAPDHLRRIWLFNLTQSFNPSNLPCGRKVVGLTLTPKTARNPVGSNHTVTANVQSNGDAAPNQTVTFTVTSGPNQGRTGTATTDANGNAPFTYQGTGPAGTDTIEAHATLGSGNQSTTVSDTATKDWFAVAVAQQQVAAQQVRAGTARLAGKTGCASRVFTARVGGSGISHVVFRIDGKRYRTVNTPNGRGKFVASIDPNRFAVGAHRLVATAVFQAARATAPKSRVLVFRRCVRKAAPSFTG